VTCIQWHSTGSSGAIGSGWKEGDLLVLVLRDVQGTRDRRERMDAGPVGEALGVV